MLLNPAISGSPGSRGRLRRAEGGEGGGADERHPDDERTEEAPDVHDVAPLRCRV